MKKVFLVIFCILFVFAFIPSCVQAESLFMPVSGAVTKFKVSIQAVGVVNFDTYDNVTDFENLGPDTVNGGNDYRVMDIDGLINPGDSVQIVVAACNGDLCVESSPLITGRPEITGPVRIGASPSP